MAEHPCKGSHFPDGGNKKRRCFLQQAQNDQAVPQKFIMIEKTSLNMPAVRKDLLFQLCLQQRRSVPADTAVFQQTPGKRQSQGIFQQMISLQIMFRCMVKPTCLLCVGLNDILIFDVINSQEDRPGNQTL